MKPLCKIAQENGGDVPLDCLFKCDRDCHADLSGVDIERRDPQCNRCRSTDVRWRQQGGKWVLFSLMPGQVHTCEINASEFGAVAE